LKDGQLIGVDAWVANKFTKKQKDG